MSKHYVVELLSKWPDRKSVLEDVRTYDQTIDPIAVHRWFQRGRVPSRYWAALLDGAGRRGIALSADDVLKALSGAGLQ